MKAFAAIDLGGTSAKCALVWEDGSLKQLKGFETGANMTRSQLEKELARVLQDAQQEAPVAGVGVSTLGVVDRQAGRVLGGTENMPCLKDFCFKSFFESICPELLVSAMNDASCAALGEQWQGAAKGCRNFVCAAFGTGVGGCVVLDGKPIEGAHHRAGEIGYWNYRSPEDYWEQYGSTLALVHEARRATGDEKLDGRELFHRLGEGDERCKLLFDRWTTDAGQVFANLALALDMERIVVGGGISAQGQNLTCVLQQKMDDCLPPDFRGECEVVPATLGNNAALLGAVSTLVQK